jgi:hypothetical protein
MAMCPACKNGNGLCPRCEGTGDIGSIFQRALSEYAGTGNCSRCDGRGEV